MGTPVCAYTLLVVVYTTYYYARLLLLLLQVLLLQFLTTGLLPLLRCLLLLSDSRSKQYSYTHSHSAETRGEGERRRSSSQAGRQVVVVVDRHFIILSIIFHISHARYLSINLSRACHRLSIYVLRSYPISLDEFDGMLKVDKEEREREREEKGRKWIFESLLYSRPCKLAKERR